MNIVKESRKSFAAEVTPDGAVTIKAPVQANDAEIDAFIVRKTKWIEKQQAYFRQFNRPERAEIVSGGSVLYLGRQYQIVIEKAAWKNAVRVLKNRICILSSAPQKTAEINADFQKWLLRRAEDVFAERLRECLKSFPDLPLPVLKIRKLKKRWGSYLKKHEIILNPDLIKANKKSIDYVIFHELCHAYFPNHSDGFYNLLSTKMPDWKQVKEKLELKLLGYN
ncbi:MAG TPA: M48 family peptidase [Alphaproteobacteria bacterium]|nr:M48 family peptidase [Alphaproteobacteria bacterium]